jgi:WD40 repeat protein
MRIEGEANPVYWSPDGSAGISVVADENQAGVWELYKVGDPAALSMIRLTNPTGWAFSPDGKQFAVASYHEDARGKPDHQKPLDAQILHVWPVDASLNIDAIPDNDTVAAIAWSPDGRWIAVIGANGRFGLWNAARQERVFSVEHPVSELNGLAWSPDSRALALTGWHHLAILSIDPSGRRAPTQWTPANYTGFDATGVAFSPDGAKVAVATDEGLVRVWDVQTHRLLDTVKGHNAYVVELAWSGDSRLLASLSTDYGTGIPPNLIVQDTLAHRVLANLTDLEPYALQMGWDSQGTKLIIAEPNGGRVLTWDAITGNTTTWAEGPLRAASLSADGHWVVYALWGDGASADTSIHILDTTTGHEIARLAAPTGVNDLAWSPDARHLVSIDANDYVTLWGEE